ncbi:MAG: D-alanyl-D-alanine carboxypeptidase [Betaproteobacteria bacterium]|nr:D-alanyl-D-alanine carboxypeptidase [Betaproteobacteria bacterium]
MPKTSSKSWRLVLTLVLSSAWVWSSGAVYAQSSPPVSRPSEKSVKPKDRPVAASKAQGAKNKPVATAKRNPQSSRPVSKAKAPASAKSNKNTSASVKQVRTERNLNASQARPVRASFGQMAGLHTTADALDLHSSVALVVDQDTHEILYRKNDHAVLPIASLTKLMTGLVIAESNLPMDEPIKITQADVDTEKGSSSRLAVGTVLSRGDLMHLSLMSSENRAANALGRTYPGGMSVFVERMNQRALSLGMKDTRYVEPTGLSSRNQSSASDLAVLVSAAYKEPSLREWSTSHGREVEVGRRTLQYNNTNRLVKNPAWDIGLQKTGYISEAGRCLVMQTQVSGRKLIMVFLDSAGKFSRLGDAERVRNWLESKPALHSGQPMARQYLPG